MELDYGEILCFIFLSLLKIVNVKTNIKILTKEKLKKTYGFKMKLQTSDQSLALL